jgi:tRNA dimethylallyltransferase
MHARPRVLAVVGLTGTGKTELACAVARRIGAEVIGADSMQVYRHMNVGTAKPSDALRREVPHHLIDVVDPDQPMSAGRYAALAREAASQIHARGRPIVVCGGTGLYVRAFVGGLVKAGSDPEVRRRLEERSTPELRADLEGRDPEAAVCIHANDRIRLVRALELLEAGQGPISGRWREHAFGDRPFDVRWIALDLERESLWRALRERVDRTFHEGPVEEVRSLHAAGYGPDLRPLRAIGYREAGWILAGRLDEPSAREATYMATRRYAKRQRTWFRAEPGVRWVDASRPEAAAEEALRLLSQPPEVYEEPIRIGQGPQSSE